MLRIDRESCNDCLYKAGSETTEITWCANFNMPSVTDIPKVSRNIRQVLEYHGQVELIEEMEALNSTCRKPC